MSDNEVRKGDVVMYYEQGDVNVEPSCAVVTAKHHGTVLSLSLFMENAPTMLPKRNVMHCEDPAIKRSPAISKTFGTWDFRASYERRKKAAEDLQREAALRAERDRRKSEENAESLLEKYADLIIQMRKERNMTPQDIAQELSLKTGVTWNYQKIGKVLKAKGLLPAV